MTREEAFKELQTINQNGGYDIPIEGIWLWHLAEVKRICEPLVTINKEIHPELNDQEAGIMMREAIKLTLKRAQLE